MTWCECGHLISGHQTGEGPWTGFCGATGCECDQPVPSPHRMRCRAIAQTSTILNVWSSQCPFPAKGQMEMKALNELLTLPACGNHLKPTRWTTYSYEPSPTSRHELPVQEVI